MVTPEELRAHVDALRESINERVHRAEFAPVKAVVYGAVGLALLTVGTIILRKAGIS